MSQPLTHLLRLTLHALCIATLGGCTAAGPRHWAGDYEAGLMRLQLDPDGGFTYDGGSCFPPHTDTDVGFSDEYRGRYRVEGGWIVLEPANGLGIVSCSKITPRLYAHQVEGHRFLFDERYLQSIAHDVRRGAPPDRYYPWHVAGAPAEFAGSPDWLPAPYARWATMPPPSARVTAVGPVQHRMRYGTAGRVEGEESFAMLTLDIGQREGAFAGMPVCRPGLEGRFWLDTVSAETATLRWAWSPSPTARPPEAGMVFESACPETQP